MADTEKILEAVEYCLTNGKCTECKFSKGRMFATCRYLMEDVFELLKEQQQIIRCKYCKYRGNIDGYCYKRNNRMAASFVEDDWFCADADPKET